jgi:GTPase SAR1 family protein
LSPPAIGNKIDREDREIPTHVGEDFAQRHSMYYLETSAKEAENVERLFMEIAAELMEVDIAYTFNICSMKLLLIPCVSL